MIHKDRTGHRQATSAICGLAGQITTAQDWQRVDCPDCLAQHPDAIQRAKQQAEEERKREWAAVPTWQKVLRIAFWPLLIAVGAGCCIAVIAS